MDDVKGFSKDLAALLNKYSAENRSGTPDFLLASYLFDCLKAYEDATVARDAWHSPESE